MKIEWDEQVLPRGSTKPGFWSKIKNNISVLRPISETGASSSSRKRPSTTRRSTHQSSSRTRERPPPRPSSAPPSSSRQVQPSHQRSSSHSRPSRPTVTIPQSGQARVTVQYGSPAPSPVRRDSAPPSSGSPRSPPAPQRRASGQTTPRVSSPLRPRGPTRAATSPMPMSVPTTPQYGYPHGVMYEGKLIVGDPKDVASYIEKQKSVSNWARHVV